MPSSLRSEQCWWAYAKAYGNRIIHICGFKVKTAIRTLVLVLNKKGRQKTFFALDEKPAALLQTHANDDFLNFIRQVGEPATNRTQPPDQPLDFDMLYKVAAETGQPVIGPPMTESEAAMIVSASE